MVKELTQNYIKAFNAKDLAAVGELLAHNFSLEDPVVKRLCGKEGCLSAIEGIFKGCKNLEFSAKNIFVDRNTAVIEFVLKIDSLHLEGVDIVEFNANYKIKELRAYLYEKK